MNNEHPTRLDRLMQVVVEHHPMRGGLALRFDDFRVCVESNSARLLATLTEYFRHYLHTADDEVAASFDLRVVAVEAAEPELGLDFSEWPLDPGKQGRKEQYADIEGGRVVRKVRTGMQFLLGPDLSLAVGACEKNENQIINLINARYTERLVDAGWVLCHAAGVASQGTGIGLAGVSGAGKSTLALRLLGRGAQFVSNDRLLVRQVGRQTRMSGLPKLPRVNPGTLMADPALRSLLSPERASQLSQLPEQTLWELEDKHDVDIERVYGPGRIALMAFMRAFVILSWKRDSAEPTRITHTTLRERPQLVELLAEHPGPFYRGGVAHSFEHSVHAPSPEPYLAAMGGVPLLEISGRVDFEQAERACMELMTPAPMHEHA